MNYASLSDTILEQVIEIMNIINNPEVDPAVRQRNQEVLFREIGEAAYTKAYDMLAWDLDIHHTTPTGIDNRFFGLAKNASDAVSAGGMGIVYSQVKNYIDQMIALAQAEAARNAYQSGKVPMVSRNTTGRENCKWCDGLVTGGFVPADDLPSEVYYRHRDCDCEIHTQGFKSRNGLLDNYIKEKKV